MAIEATCPSCGTRDVRLSQRLSLAERVRSWFGIYPLRCRRCNARFDGKIWAPTLVIYARCPKCYRMALSTWSKQYYNPAFTVNLKLALGATPYRCEFCRCNFASFRACKERFLWRNYRRPKTEETDTADSVQV